MYLIITTLISKTPAKLYINMSLSIEIHYIELSVTILTGAMFPVSDWKLK